MSPDGVADSGELFPEVVAPAKLPADEASPADKRFRLLVVEDHEATLQVLIRLLTAAGHSVIGVKTIAQALAAAAENAFDLVISDLGLPDGTGTELMKQLRDTYGLRGIALSGYGMNDDIARSLAAGFIAHLTKPVDFVHLQRALYTSDA